MIEIQEDDYPNEVDSQNYILSNQIRAVPLNTILLSIKKIIILLVENRVLELGVAAQLWQFVLAITIELTLSLPLIL